MADYLAIIFIGGGSSHGRSSDKEKAIQYALRYLRDWESVFTLPEQDINIQVTDVDGYDRVVFGMNGLTGTNEKTGVHEKIERESEIVTRHFTPKKRKAS